MNNPTGPVPSIRSQRCGYCSKRAEVRNGEYGLLCSTHRSAVARAGVPVVDHSRYPVEPLRALLKATGVTWADDTLRLPRGQIAKWVDRGGLTWSAADQVAVTAGFHPAEIWPEWADHNAEQAQGTNA